MARSRFSATAPSRPAPRLGSEEPRVFTPPLRRLTPKTSLGFSAIQFATEVLGVELFPWQRWLLIHALELHPDGGLRFRTILVLVARQNGKSTLSQVLALWFMCVYGFDLVLGAAQDLDTAEEIWQGTVDLVTEVDEDDKPVRPELFELHEHTVQVNGKKSLNLKTGARYKAKAATRRAGRGLSGDLVMLDELREHQNWDAWGAITKTTMARAEAQIWGLSNAGDGQSVVLDYLRRLAHAALGDPDGLNPDGEPVPTAGPDEQDVDVDELVEDSDLDDDSLAIFEWSATPGCDIWDRDEWARANPSLGHGITERTIAAAARTDPEAIFRTEVLCQWVETLTPSALDLDRWKAQAAPKTPRGEKPKFAVATAPDRSWSAIAVAWIRPDDGVHVVLSIGDDDDVDYRPGAAWVQARIDQIKARWQINDNDVLVNKAARGLVKDAEEPSEDDQAQADNRLADLLEAGTLTHGNESALRTAVRGSRWRSSGNTRVLDQKGDVEISPLTAAALAVWKADEDRDEGVQFW